MKNIIYFLMLIMVIATNSMFAQSSCASLVKNIGFEKKRGNIEYVTKLNTTTALFYAEDQYYGRELWRTDGTLQGTLLVKDIAAGTSSSRGGYTNNPNSYELSRANKPVVQNGIMYFEANDAIHGYEVWRSDGTTNGTFMLQDLNTDVRWQNDPQHRFFYLFNNEVYFWDDSKSWTDANDNTARGQLFRLFKTKGTPETTVLAGEFVSEENVNPPALIEFKGTIAFTLRTPYSLFTTQKSIFYQIDSADKITQTQLHSDGVFDLGVANGQLFFSNKNGLYKSDGTVSGTILVREKGSVFTGVSPGGRFWDDGKLVYFISVDDLWRTDGTTMGTYAIQNNLDIDFLDLDKEQVFIYKNELYFVTYGSPNNRFKGDKLWKTNGTVEGTIPVVDLDPESKGRAYIRLVTEIDGNLFFYGKVEGVTADLDAKSGIWKTDGTQVGTKLSCPLGPDLSCLMINPTYDNYGFLSIDKSLLFLGFPTNYANNNYDDTELYRTSLTNCPSITATITGTPVFCPGGTTTLSATAAGGTGPYTYRWQQGSTTVGSGTTSLTINAAGTYTVTTTDANGCAGTAQITVTQRTSPTVSLPTTVAFCSGQSTTLTALVIGGTSPYTYQWKQGTANAGSTVATLTVNTGGTYAVTVTDASGCASASATTTVTQRPSPTSTVTASAPGFTTGGNVILSANTGVSLTYQWTRDGQSIAGATKATYTAQQPGSYAVVVAQDGCTTTSQALTINLITAIEEPQSGVDFQVSASPNPSSGIVEIRIDSHRGKTVFVTLLVRDLTGRSLYQKQIRVNGQHTESLDLSQQPAGLYLLNAATDSQQSHLRLIRQ